MVFVSFICPMLALFFVTSFLVKIINRKFGDCLPLTIMILPIILVFTHYTVKNLLIGVYIIYAIILTSVIIFILNIRKAEYRNKIFSVGFCIFIFIYCFIYLITRNRYYHGWDEFGFWGPIVDQLVENNRMYTGLSHVSYPPLVQLFEYILTKFGLLFEEYNVLFSVQLLNFSIFCVPFSERLDEDDRLHVTNVVKGVVLFIVSFLLAAGIDSYMSFLTIYIDTSVSMFFAYVLYLIIYNEDKCIIALAFFALMLVKDISIMILILALSFITISFVVDLIKEDDKKKAVNEYLKTIGAVVLPAIISYALWFIYKINAGLLDEQFSIGKFSIFDFFAIFTGKLTEDKLAAFNTFFNAIFKENLARSPIPFTYFNSFVLLMLILVVLALVYKKDYAQMAKMMIFTIIAYILYMLFMLNMYVNIFKDLESLELASYKRYIATFVLGIYLTAIVFLYRNTNLYRVIFTIFAIISILLSVEFLSTLSPSKNDSLRAFKNERNIYTQLTTHVNKEDKCIIVKSKNIYDDLVKNYYNKNNVHIDIYDTGNFVDEENIKTFYENLENYKYISVIDPTGIVYETFYVTIKKYIEDNSIDDKYGLRKLQANKIMPIN